MLKNLLPTRVQVLFILLLAGRQQLLTLFSSQVRVAIQLVRDDVVPLAADGRDNAMVLSQHPPGHLLGYL